jgi:iron complex outermembrane recepter protein
MFKRTKLCSGLMLAFGGVAALSSPSAYAQQQLERVEITGSSIKRIDSEGALPVLVIKKEDIQRSGVTSTVDLLRKLPTVQGQTGESASVGGQTFGFSGVSIHNIGESRTLVLLNGHRLTLFGGQQLTGFAAGFDLNAIPISAIERVEVLSDGASALYGADAIAGVVNFITKRDTSEGDITVGISNPKGGAKEKRFSITKGFGSLEKDGYNAFLSFGHDERTNLFSTQRDFAKSGVVNFSQNGKNYRLQQFSASPIPANATDDAGNLISPYQKVNGTCPPKTFRVIDGTDDYCGFDFVGELEIYPERKRDSFFGSANAKLGDHTLFADVLVSRTSQVSRIAPVPGSISIPAGSPLHTKYLLPLGIVEDSLAFYRVYDLGKRTNDDKVDFLDFALGSKGLVFGWDYNATYTHSDSKAANNISGYPGALALRAVRASGLLDPFVGPGQQSAAGQAALDKSNFKGYWDGGQAKLDTLSLKGSKELMTLPAGVLALGLGANFNKEQFQSKPSLYSQGKLADPVAGTLCDPGNPALPCDTRFGDSATTVPYSANRKSYGVFGELVIPVLKNLEFTASFRHDNYDDFGNADTAKGSFRWNPVPSVLVRGSIGTGFHAPTVPQVNASIQPFGVTSDKYTCTAELLQLATSLGAKCQPGNRQYDQFAGGNSQLSPEKSRQGTLGIRVEPSKEVSIGADLWHVAIKDSFGQLPEQTVFATPLAFPTSWTKKLDIGTGTTYLSFLANNKNLGKSYATGLDLDVTGRTKTGFGDLSSQLTLTYMIREQQQIETNGQYYSAIGNFAELGTVTFRWQGRLATSLKVGAWTHALGLNFKSGYDDQQKTVDVIDSAGNVTGSEKLRLTIERYMTADWQTSWIPVNNLTVTGGLLNVFDTKPPLSLSTSGTNKGQQFGYDDRYYDPRGRTLYANISYKF